MNINLRVVFSNQHLLIIIVSLSYQLNFFIGQFELKRSGHILSSFFLRLIFIVIKLTP